MFVVIGTTTVDLFVSGIEKMPRFDGDEFTTSSLAFCNHPLRTSLGGNGANSAYVLATLGMPTALCSATGVNPLGDITTGWLEDRGVDLQGFIRTEDGTATTTIIMDDNHNRISYYYQGIFPTYGLEDIPTDLLQRADALLITGCTILGGLRSAGFASLLKTARQSGTTTYMDIGPAVGDPIKLQELVPFLSSVDYLLTNANELSVCTSKMDIEAGAADLLAAGANSVVVKCGKDGARIFQQHSQIYVQGFSVPTHLTVGAGDLFNAGFMVGIQQGMHPVEAARFGNVVAALVVQSGQGILGAPNMDEVKSLLQQV